MRRIVRFFLVAASIVSCHAWAEPEDELRALLDQGREEDAFRLGQAHPERHGQPAFDFFFGIAAIESGHAGVGVAALERFLRDYPDNRSARYQLAHGYYVLGADARAQEIFSALLPQAAGEERVAIERFLDVLQQRQARDKPTGSMFFEAGIGLDSNINAGLSGGSTPSIPGIGAMPALSGGALASRQRARFMSFAGEATGVLPLTSGYALTGSLAFDGRTHAGWRNDVFDQMNVGASGGIGWKQDDSTYKFGAGASQMGVDYQRYVLTTNLFAEWDWQANRAHQLDVATQIGRYEHDDMLVYADKDKTGARQLSRNSLRSADFFGLAGGWTWLLEGDWLPTLRLSANYGQERNRRERDDLSRDLAGARLALSLAPTPRWGLWFGFGTQIARHKDTFAFPGATASRHDRMDFLEAGISYRWDRNIVLKLDHARQRQRSNIDFYLYERDVSSFKLRYDFK